jgi:hypothetical protein
MPIYEKFNKKQSQNTDPDLSGLDKQE